MSTLLQGVQGSQLKSNHVEPQIHTHLNKVYRYLCLTNLTAGLVAIFGLLHPVLYVSLSTVTHVVALGLTVEFTVTHHRNKERIVLQFNLLLALINCLCLNLIPWWWKFAITSTVTAFLTTSVVFVSFSLCTLFSERSKWLFLGVHPMAFVIFTVGLMTTWQLFGIGFTLLYNCKLYLDLYVISDYVFADTQEFLKWAANIWVNVKRYFRERRSGSDEEYERTNSETQAAATAMPSRPDEERKCMLCLVSNRTHLCVPCGHFIMCEPCVDALWATHHERWLDEDSGIENPNPPCPQCRTPIENVLKVISPA